MNTSLKHIGLRAKAAVGKVLTSIPVQILVSYAFPHHVPFRGLRITSHSGADRDRTKCSLLFRMYESAEIRFIEKYLSPDSNVIELGASIGVTSCIIRKMMHPQKRFVCVEADPDLIRTLRMNLSQNGLERDVTVLHSAVVGSPAHGGTARFFRSSDSTTGRLAMPSADHVSFDVPAMTLDHIVGTAGIESFALVCDIEGAEWQVLRTSTALSMCHLMIIEFHDMADDPQQCHHETLLQQCCREFGFSLVDRYGHVCVLKKGVGTSAEF